jgi:hypothetical protein
LLRRTLYKTITCAFIALHLQTLENCATLVAKGLHLYLATAAEVQDPTGLTRLEKLRRKVSGLINLIRDEI